MKYSKSTVFTNGTTDQSRSFFLALDPPTVTAQERKVRIVKGRPLFYDTQRIKDAKELLTAHLSQHAPDQPMQGPLYLNVAWCFKGKGHKNGEPKITRPDTDNLEKMLKDCMTKCGYWNDDAQVVQEKITKIWNNPPGIYIQVGELGGKE